jgi:hypothetical protein
MNKVSCPSTKTELLEIGGPVYEQAVACGSNRDDVIV